MTQHYIYFMKDGRILENEHPCTAHFYTEGGISWHLDEVETFRDIADIFTHPGHNWCVDDPHFRQYADKVWKAFHYWMDCDLCFKFNPHMSRPFVLFVLNFVRSLTEDKNLYPNFWAKMGNGMHPFEILWRLFRRNDDFSFYNTNHQAGLSAIRKMQHEEVKLVVDNWWEFLRYLRTEGDSLLGSGWETPTCDDLVADYITKKKKELT